MTGFLWFIVIVLGLRKMMQVAPKAFRFYADNRTAMKGGMDLLKRFFGGR